MSLPNQASPQMMVTSGYNIPVSLRFRSSASAYLSRTFAAAPVVRTKQTFSCWFKRGQLGVAARLFDCYDGTSTYSTALYFNTNDTLELDFGGSSQYNIVTNQVFRDPSAWYHLVISIDTTQSTAANRVIWYLNGTQITSFSTANYPAQNSPSQWTINTANNKIMAQWSSVAFLDGYLAEVNFIDGQALNQFYFGAYDSNGVWQPLAYTGNYGTNGFYLNFKNTSSTTTLGNDTSGNGNNWTTNNISLTTGSTYDSMLDSPNQLGTASANYCIMNPIDVYLQSSGTSGLPSYTNGNLTTTGVSSGTTNARGSFGMSSGLWYWEVTLASNSSNNSIIGFAPLVSPYPTTYALRVTGSYNGLTITSGSAFSFTTGDTIGIALNATAQSSIWYKNGVQQFVATYSASLPVTPWTQLNGPAGDVYNWNFGQQPYKYTPPTGYNPLSTAYLPTSNIPNGAAFMAASLYTGNGTALTVNNGTNNNSRTVFQPDFVWIKDRSSVSNHAALDSVRPTGYGIYPNLNVVEGNNSSLFTGITSTGFGIAGTNITYNQNGDSYVAWQWQAGQGQTLVNTYGNITSTTSVNQAAGFSIVTWTGTGTGAATVGHGLSVLPQFVMIKKRNVVGDWYVATYYSGQGLNYAYHLFLDTTSALSGNNDPYYLGSQTSLTSNVLNLAAGNPNNGGNELGTNYVAYCWTPIPGYSAFGSGGGNGSSDGPFQYTGFRPRFVLAKTTSGTSDWYIWDTSRNPYNTLANLLYPDLTNAEYTSTGDYFDLLSNGFKSRGAGNVNGSGNSYIWAAFAENPFALARAR